MATTDLTASVNDHPAFTRAGTGRLVTKKFDAAEQNLAQNDIAQLIPVKAGEYVAWVISNVLTADANAGTFDIGDGATADGYVDGQDAAATGYSPPSLGSAEAFADGKVYTADDTIDLIALGASGMTTGVVEVTALIYDLNPR